MVLKILFSFLLIAFIGGNLSSISSGSGMRITLLDVSVLLIVGYFFLTSRTRLKQLYQYLYIYGAFILIAFMTLLLQVNRFSLSELTIASLYLWRFISYSLLTVVVLNSKELKKYAYLALWNCGVVLGILGLIQYFLYPNLRNLSYLGWDPHEYRIFSTLLDPNFTGIILVLTLILSNYLIQQRNHKNVLWNKFVIMVSGVTFLAFLLTYSRGSYIAFIVSLFVWSLVTRRLKFAVMATIVFLGSILFLPHPRGEGVRLLRSISVQSRWENSLAAIQIFSQQPLFGVGFDTLRFVREKTEIDSGTIDVSHSGAGFHNSWLFILTTTGIFGFIAYGFIWRNIYIFTKEKELLLTTFTAVGVHSLFDNSLFYPWVMVWLWLLVGGMIKVDRSPSVPN